MPGEGPAGVSAELAARVCPCAAAVAGRVYPVPRPAGPVNDVFSAAVVREVGDVLEVAGFPRVEDDSPDWYALSWCLWRFVYGYGGRGRHSGDTDDPNGPDGPGPGHVVGGDQVSLW